MVNPHKKGKRGELELVQTLKRYFPNYRIKRISGTEKSRVFITGDVYCPDGILKRFHWENKNRERLNVHQALSKATGDAQGKIPVLRWQKSYYQPIIILREKDFLNLLVELDGYNDQSR